MGIDNLHIIQELLKADRSVRRFDESKPVSEDALRSMIELTRYCASGRNVQPLRYRIVTSDEERAKVFPLLAWAGYLTDWNGPAEGERPAAYLVQCLDTRYGKNCLCDDGLQLQAITLAATAMGIGNCIIKSFNTPRLHKELNLPDEIEARYVLALGYPAEKVITEDTDGSPDADIRYYRAEDDTHHVPKRPLDELIIK